MWTKNSSRFLPTVLKRIEEVIPSEAIQNKIIIDDHSTDNTVEVAKSLGWNVHKNQGKGISDAYQTALNFISSEYLVSVEHDVILSKEWWNKISIYMKNNKVAVAQGVRASTNPTLRKIDEYVIERQDERAKMLNLSLDNNLYRMDIISKFGINVVEGMSACHALEEKGFKWIIDITVISDHIRPDIWYLMEHDYKWHKYILARYPRLNRRAEFMKNFKLFLFSPFRALHIVLKKRCPQVLIVYPLDRLAILKAYVEPIPKH